MNKPTMQRIADDLSISRISVWRALTDRPGVSDELRDEVRAAALAMGYDFGEVALPVDNTPARTVSVIVSRPESSSFWMEIIHQMAMELSENHVNLMYTYLPNDPPQGYVLPPTLKNGMINGAIILNIYSEPLLKLLADLDKPKVFLDTVPSIPFEDLNGDLVLIEGFGLVKDITMRLIDNDYTRLGFIGDINYAQTNLDRYRGFFEGHRLRGLTVHPELCLTERLGVNTHFEQISRFLDGISKLPDAIVCPSDYIAHYVQQYFAERNIPEAERPLLTGFDKSSEYTNVGEITTVEVKTKMLGSRLANKILYSMNHTNCAPELSYVRYKIEYKTPLQ